MSAEWLPEEKEELLDFVAKLLKEQKHMKKQIKNLHERVGGIEEENELFTLTENDKI